MKWRTHTFKQTQTLVELSRKLQDRAYAGNCDVQNAYFLSLYNFFFYISARGIYTVKLMKLKLQGPIQGPERGLSNVFAWSYVFVKFAKARYFNHSRLTIIEIRQAFNSYRIFFLWFYVYGICQLFKFVICCDFFLRYK